MKPAVVAIIKGGLGNQLFGYAAALALARRTGRALLIDDTSGFARDGYGRRYRLDRFPVSAEPAHEALRLGDPKGLRHRAARQLDKLRPATRRGYVRETADSTPRQLLHFRSTHGVVQLNGYWQDERYFADAAEAVRAELTPPEVDPALEAELAAAPTVFLHIRRHRYSPRLAPDYYERSIEWLVRRVPDCRFEVFGDDLDWARGRLDFLGRPSRFHESGPDDELRDLRLMTACRHGIAANSSFSWWAAWLGAHTDRLVATPENPGWPVVAPERWHRIANDLEP